MTDTALYLIATPIGDDGDLSPRATRLLLDAELVIGEEFRPLTTLLKRIGRPRKPAENNQADPELEVLNEHSKPDDVRRLADRIEKIARSGRFTALISDCGTPGFCDPGAPLVQELRLRGLRSSTAPGASSLMCLLSLCGQPLTEFVFRGFLPNDREEREQALKALAHEDRPVVVMDTPYRLEKLLGELSRTFPARLATLGCDFTSPSEQVLSGTLQSLAKQWSERPADQRKAEFMILLHAANEPSQNSRRVDEPRPNIQSRVHANEKQTFPRKKKK
ncbi:MAG: methyltransferase [Deltaproteobacteria bacterium]|nr:methyltransferase [Deltaproteobacteria bacterium]